MKKLQLLAILSLLSLSQAYSMDDAHLKRGKDIGTIDPAKTEGSARPVWGGQPVRPVVAPAPYTGDPRRGKDFGTIDVTTNTGGFSRPAVLYGGQPVQSVVQPAPYASQDRRGKDYGAINIDPISTPAVAHTYTATPAAAADAGIRYNKPLPTPPVKKAAAAVVLSAANQTLVNNLVAKLTELGAKINSLNDKIPTVASTVKSGDVTQYLDPKFIKTAFWTGIRGGQAFVLTKEIKGEIQKLNQTDAATQQVAKEKVTPVLTSAAFTTAVRNLEDQLSKLPEPLSSEAKNLIDVTRFLKAQFNLK